MIAAWFLLFQAHEALAPLFTSGASLPWSMFGARCGPDRLFWAEGLTERSAPLHISFERWFRYRRGFSSHTLVYQHGAMKRERPRDKRARRELALWMAQRVCIEDGVRLNRVVIWRATWSLSTQKKRETTLSDVFVPASTHTLPVAHVGALAPVRHGRGVGLGAAPPEHRTAHRYFGAGTLSALGCQPRKVGARRLVAWCGSAADRHLQVKRTIAIASAGDYSPNHYEIACADLGAIMDADGRFGVSMKRKWCLTPSGHERRNFWETLPVL